MKLIAISAFLLLLVGSARPEDQEKDKKKDDGKRHMTISSSVERVKSSLIKHETADDFKLAVDDPHKLVFTKRFSLGGGIIRDEVIITTDKSTVTIDLTSLFCVEVRGSLHCQSAASREKKEGSARCVTFSGQGGLRERISGALDRVVSQDAYCARLCCNELLTCLGCCSRGRKVSNN